MSIYGGYTVNNKDLNG